MAHLVHWHLSNVYLQSFSAPGQLLWTKIHLLSKNSVLTIQLEFHYYLNYPIRSDGALTKVLLCESIRVGENVLKDNKFYFPPRDCKRSSDLKRTHMFKNASRNSQSHTSIWGVLQQKETFVRHIHLFKGILWLTTSAPTWLSMGAAERRRSRPISYQFDIA